MNVAVFVLLLLATEATVRVSGARAPRIDPPDAMRTRSLWQYDATKGWSLRPGASAVTRNPSGLGGDDGVARINALGLRGPMPAIPKPAGRYRVVCVGDSYLFGAGIDEEHLFKRLEERGIRTFRMDRPLAEARARAPQENWDFGDDAHWNVPAHEEAARIASSHLRTYIEAP